MDKERATEVQELPLIFPSALFCATSSVSTIVYGNRDDKLPEDVSYLNHSGCSSASFVMCAPSRVQVS